ncbi:MAG: methyl-accepting chemotaxis protein [Planctomycetota bacterium]
MSTWTIPRRITVGFLLLVLLTLLVGGLSIWQIVGIRRNVVDLADNAVPTVVMLNNIIKQNTESVRQVRAIVEQVEAEPESAVSEAAYKDAVDKGTALCVQYDALVSDAEDERLFRAATAARGESLTVARDVIALAASKQIGEAKQMLRADLDPVVTRVTKAFDDDIAYNIKLAAAAGERAKANAGLTAWLLSAAGGLSVILGSLVGWSIIRAVSRSLGLISNALAEGASQTSAASGQLATASNSLAQGCAEQGSSVAETSAALEQMSAMIRSTADNAEKAKAYAMQARTAAQAGAQTMLEMTTAMHAIEASSAEVAKIVKNIDEIAFQTNILALNAAVEAARAGEAGAGFAVVADEVRSLTQRSAAAAKETAEKIEAAIANSKRGSISCDKVGESLDEIVQKVAAADGLVAEIATAAKEQSQGIQQVGVAMTQMDKVTQGNASSAQESAAAAEELNSQAHAMQETVRALRALVRRSSGGAAEPGAAPRPASRRAVAATRSRPRIAMPGDVAGPDHEDRNFANF